MASKSAYGNNPHAGVNMNADLDWGGYKWPNGVPANLLGVVQVRDLKWTFRKELCPLVTALVRITEEKYGYDIEGWQSWSYENRPIGRTQTASNHSKGKAADINATENPYSAQFICTIPPEVVALFEAHGFYWGGRYNGETDTMHIEFCASTYEVPRFLVSAAAILGEDTSTPAPLRPFPSRVKGKSFGPKNVARKDFPAGSTQVMTGYEQDKNGPGRRAAIQQIQRALGITADGYYGSKTVTAVKEFQQKTKCSQPTGWVGPLTWKALKIK